MIRLRVSRMMLARFPNFVQQKRTGSVRRAVQIVLQAAVFFASWRYQRLQFRLKEWFVTRARAHKSDDRDATLRQLGMICSAASFRASALPRSFLRLLFGHRGGDCTPNSAIGKSKPFGLWRPVSGFVLTNPEVKRRAFSASDSGLFSRGRGFSRDITPALKELLAPEELGSLGLASASSVLKRPS